MSIHDPTSSIHQKNLPTPATPTRTRVGYSSPKLSLTHLLALRLNSLGSSLHNLAASTFAGLSSFGLDSMEITDSRIVSGVCTGDQRSAVDS